MESFGAYLKAQRESKGIRLEEIASITKIHIHALEHLEAGRFHKLPPDPFIRGFIIAYAKYVGLDPKETVSRYGEAIAALQPEPAKDRATRTDAPKPTRLESTTPSYTMAPSTLALAAKPSNQISRGAPSANEIIAEPNALPIGKLVGAGAGIVALGIVIGLIYVGKQSSENSTVVVSQSAPAETGAEVTSSDSSTAQAESAQSAQTASAQSSQTTRPEENAKQANATPVTPQAAGTTGAPREAAAVTPKHKLVIQGKERTWLKVVVDDKAPLEYFLPKGQTVGYVASEKIKLVLGEATNAAVYHNDLPVAGFKLKDDVSIFVFPTGAKFPQDAAAKKGKEGETAEGTPQSVSQ